MSAQSPKQGRIPRESIKREYIDYVVCSSCRVVFPDKGSIHNCPICSLTGNVDGAFPSYVTNVTSADEVVASN